MEATLHDRARRGEGLLVALLAAGLFSLATGFYLAWTAPPDANQGYLVRILYLHVPAAWTAYLAFLVNLVYSTLYLVRRDLRYDRVAAASAELGLGFLALTLLGGMMWGRPTWGVYWTWEPRLTTTAILFWIYAGYFVLRGVVAEPAARARVAAALGILGALNVPISYLSVKWWRGLHQTQSIDLTTGRVHMAPEMLQALLVNVLAFTLLYLGLLRLRSLLALRRAERGEADGD